MQEFESWSNKPYQKYWKQSERSETKANDTEAEDNRAIRQVSSLAEKMTCMNCTMAVHSGLEIYVLSLISDISFTFVAKNAITVDSIKVSYAPQTYLITHFWLFFFFYSKTKENEARQR